MKSTQKILPFILTAMAVLGFNSCSKEEGKGGNAAIQGYVYNIINDGDIVSDGMGGWKFGLDTVKALDKSVFIVYGGGIGEYDDKTVTNGYGYYKFDFLRSGDYTIYAIGDSSDAKKASFRNISIGSSGTHTVKNIYLENGKNANCSGVIGCIKAKYSSETDFVTGIGVRVYIKNINGGEQNDTRTDNEGNFRFARLQPHTKYTVWAESESKKNGAIEAVGYEVETGSKGTIINKTDSPIEVKIY
ncbi:MAG: carboxypeptidase-like regulatory domain-containing protein [Paludibacteraceae bacterium]|nr:carboxypeptidase-like regulatory domain-containing protein [Paludibacteraceae bacterium]